MNAKITTAILAALAVLAVATPANAQDWDNPEGGDWGTQQNQNQQQQQQQDPNQQQQQDPNQQQQQDPNQQQQQPNAWQTQQTQQTQSTQTTQTTQQTEAPPQWATGDQAVATADGPATGDDHTDVAVGNLAVGFLGSASVPIGAVAPGLGQPVNVVAPTIGVRYWLSELIGLDVGLGFGFRQNSVETDMPPPAGVTGGTTSTAFAFSLHGGLPIALFHAKHYKFLIVPELDLGFGSGTIFGATANDDINLSGFAFEVGARAAAEIHFGFIGVPELALQAGVGLSFMFSTRTTEYARGAPGGATFQSESTIDLGTRYDQDEPWDIFIGSLTALYYFR